MLGSSYCRYCSLECQDKGLEGAPSLLQVGRTQETGDRRQEVEGCAGREGAVRGTGPQRRGGRRLTRAAQLQWLVV